MEVYFHKERNEGKHSCYVNHKNIRAEMARNNYNIADMAKLMGITRPTYCALVNGNIEPGIKRMIKLARVLSMPVESLFNFNWIGEEKNREEEEHVR